MAASPARSPRRLPASWVLVGVAAVLSAGASFINCMTPAGEEGLGVERAAVVESSSSRGSSGVGGASAAGPASDRDGGTGGRPLGGGVGGRPLGAD
jgi:hypothetical protein